MAMVNTEKLVGNNNNIQHVNLKTCGVCGDKALGYNFNAVTCESCKAFFRRNALTTKEFRCLFNGDCEITVVKRRFCQKCRLDKCFAIGMRKEYIMSEEDKEIKRKKIEFNRAKKRSSIKVNEVDYSNKVKRDNYSTSDESSNDYSKRTTGQCLLVIDNKLPSETNGATPGVISNNPESTVCTPDYILDVKNEFLFNDSKFSSEDTFLHTNSAVTSIENDSTAYQIVEMQSDNSSNSFVNGTSGMASTGSDTNIVIHNVINPLQHPATSNRIGTEPSILSELIGTDIRCRNQNGHMKSSVLSDSMSMLDVTRDVLQDVQRIPIEPNSIESILCEAIKLEFEAYTTIASTHANSSRELNDAERAKLNELIVANKALLQPVDDDVSYVAENGTFMPSSQGLIQTPVLLDVINLTAVAIRRLIKMAKKINAFKNMCQEDQVALLKGGCTEMMILRSAMTYDQSKRSWKIPHSQESLSRIKVDILKQAKGNIYEEHERFIKTFDPKWRMDENIILIMCAITLFTPDRPRVIHEDVIKLEQNSYYYLLRRYLESIYPGCEAKSTFLKLIQKISELHRLNGEVISVYLDVNPSDVEPLLIEIFDLKPH